MTPYMWILLFAGLALTKAQELSLEDAFGDDDPPVKPTVAKPTKKPGDDLNLLDALGDEDEPKPAEPKKPVAPPKTGGDGFSDSDLGDAAGDGYRPDPGRGGRSGGNGYNNPDPQDDPEGNSQATEGGPMAGIISAVAVAIFGAASSYFAYQKKKLCFKGQGGPDPESGRNQSGAHSDPQSFSNLLRT